VICRQKSAGTILMFAALGFGIGCNKQTQQADHGGSPEPPPDHPGFKADWNVAISDANGVCYTDHNWIIADAPKTITWSSTTGAKYIVEFSTPTPLTDKTGKAAFAVPVPATGPSDTYTINKQSACSATSISACFYQYTIVKVSKSTINPGDFCGPSPMTVGIHIKP
jgi:hypothetical protein